MANQSTIPITFDKSHLATIGSRLYSESLDLIRELVANAYDADATKVKITTSEDALTVEDNGEGMDRAGLEQYFTIGSGFKRENNVSPRFHRARIGEFGIGKFAVLALCDRFELFTRKNGLGYTAVFDRGDFEHSREWEVPILEHAAGEGESGTRVALNRLKKPLGGDQLERKLRRQLPLAQPDFLVSLNGAVLRPHYVPGRRFRIREATEFGVIAGEVIISSLMLPAEITGVGLRVKGIEVLRDFFGLERGKNLSPRRLTGEIAADFLPVTAARDKVIQDSREYEAFRRVLDKHLKRIGRQLAKFRENRGDIKADKALSEALLKVRQALRLNKDFLFTHDLPLFTPEKGKNEVLQEAMAGIQAAKVGKKKGKENFKIGDMIKKAAAGIKRINRARVKTVLKDKKRLVKKLKIGGVNIVCSLTHLGNGEAESFSEGGVIFINRDHPLYVQASGNDEVTAYHLARLITQELVLLADPDSSGQAYEWQSRLISDALVSRGRPTLSKAESE